MESYPGMFVRNANQSNSLKGVFAPYPERNGKVGTTNYKNWLLQEKIMLRSVPVDEVFPWRIAIVSSDDKELLDNDMVYKLAAPSRLEDTSMD